ncbi:unnamed protein product [Protopolystoma xenopodis]|uniref:Uncharacterized protein n=1 Tax=Protopolystoma xenopodis TaxID=117903 RepID=A0A448XQ53_9PLAT|nr:unnamed protein product [Protopolystoma xenopodis]
MQVHGNTSSLTSSSSTLSGRASSDTPPLGQRTQSLLQTQLEEEEDEAEEVQVEGLAEELSQVILPTFQMHFEKIASGNLQLEMSQPAPLTSRGTSVFSFPTLSPVEIPESNVTDSGSKSFDSNNVIKQDILQSRESYPKERKPARPHWRRLGAERKAITSKAHLLSAISSPVNSASLPLETVPLIPTTETPIVGADSLICIQTRQNRQPKFALKPFPMIKNSYRGHQSHGDLSLSSFNKETGSSISQTKVCDPGMRTSHSLNDANMTENLK